MNGRLIRSSSGRQQRGNALVFALLGLIVAAGVSATAMQARLTQARVAAGQAEATLLDALRNATNAAILDQLSALQSGAPLTRLGTSVPPTLVGTDLVWRPSPLQLAAMGYLPPQWTTTRSTLNGAPYQIEFQRSPSGCAPSACGMEGRILISGAIQDTTAGQPDHLSIGPILTRIGADAGLSLQTNPGQITGYARSWSTVNPVAGSPAGVVAVRVGTSGASMSQFVRLRDIRDPDLQGALSVAGAARLQGPVNVGPAASPCIRLSVDGVLSVDCTGRVDARSVYAQTTTLTDAAGSTTTITGSALSVGGSLQAATTIAAAGSMTAGGDLTSNGVARASQFQPTTRWAPGAPCVNEYAVAANARDQGLVLCTAGAWRPIVTQHAEGAICSDEGAQASQDGIALICSSGTYVQLRRFTTRGSVGSTCTTSGAIALDLDTGITVLCRSNPRSGARRWHALNDLVSNIAFIAQTLVTDSDTLSKPDCLTTPGASGGTPAVYLQGQTEGSSNATFDRYVIDNGTSWTAYLRDSTGTPLGGATALAQVYCYY